MTVVKKKIKRKRKHFLGQLWCFFLTHLFEFQLDAFLKEGNFHGWCLTEPTEKEDKNYYKEYLTCNILIDLILELYSIAKTR